MNVKVDLLSVTQSPYAEQKLSGEISRERFWNAAAYQMSRSEKYSLLISDWIAETYPGNPNIMLTFAEEGEGNEKFVFSENKFNEETNKIEKVFLRALTEDEIAFIKPLTDKYNAVIKDENPTPQAVH